MFHLDHFSLAARNIYKAAFDLRAETGLGFYDGGWTASGLGSKVFPLGGGCYLIVEGVVDVAALRDPANAALRRFHEGVAAADAFRGFALRTDTLEELQAVAQARGFAAPSLNPTGGRWLNDGQRLVTAGAPGPAAAWPKGLPIWNYFPDMTRHPAGQPVSPAPGLAAPRGVAWVEVGGRPEDFEGWLGAPASQFRLKFNGAAPGLYAVGVDTDQGERVIRRPPMAVEDRG